jgi:predicted acylesterase/phospholipase RssA
MTALSEVGAALQHIQETREEVGGLHSFMATAAHEPQACLLDHFLGECRCRLLTIGAREREVDTSLSSLDSLISELSSRYLAGASSDRLAVTVGSLAASDIARLLPLVFLASRSVEEALERKLSRLEKHVEGTLKKLKLGGGSRDELLGDELKRLLTGFSRAPITSLILPFQTFSSRTASDMLCAVIEKSPRLVVVDLSHCLIGDQRMMALLGPLSTLQHLSCLVLTKNALTGVFSSAFLQALTREGSSCSFPALRGVSLAENDISEQDMTSVQSSIRDIQDRRLPKKRACLPSQLVAVFDAPCMRSAAIAYCLHMSASTDEMMALSSKFDIFCGSSFSAIIAVAVAMKLPSELIVAFFRTISKTVFATTPYLSLMNHAGRVVRDWWTAGNFYSAAALRAALVDLFTESTLKVHFDALSALIGKKVVLFAAAGSSDEVSDASAPPVVFRSFLLDGPDDRASPTPTLEDVLMACCATPTFFASLRLAKTDCVDHLYVPISCLVADLLPLLKLDAEMALTVFTTSNPSEDRFLSSSNPLVSLALAACLSAAPKRGRHGSPPSTLLTSLRQKVELSNATRLGCAGVSLAVKQVLLPGKNCDDVALDEGNARTLGVALPNKVRKIDFSSFAS